MIHGVGRRWLDAPNPLWTARDSRQRAIPALCLRKRRIFALGAMKLQVLLSSTMTFGPCNSIIPCPALSEAKCREKQCSHGGKQEATLGLDVFASLEARLRHA